MATWKLDNGHSHINFKVKHLVVSTVNGEFKKYEGVVESSKDDFSDARITFEADVDSISTGQEMRDGHLKSDLFFNTAVYPKLKFVSTEMKKVDGENYKLTGNMTIRDKTLPITLDVVYGGTVKDAQGQTRSGFEIHGKFNRRDFGLHFTMTTEAGTIVVGDDVKIEIAAEVIKQA
jgi:polyisoprenoid-binding protein YceI